jgi:hypothetical protein
LRLPQWYRLSPSFGLMSKSTVERTASGNRLVK